MKSSKIRAGAAALTLVVCLSVAPVALAVPGEDRSEEVRAKVWRLLKQFKKFSVSILQDQPVPPKP